MRKIGTQDCGNQVQNHHFWSRHNAQLASLACDKTGLNLADVAGDCLRASREWDWRFISSSGSVMKLKLPLLPIDWWTMSFSTRSLVVMTIKKGLLLSYHHNNYASRATSADCKRRHLTYEQIPLAIIIFRKMCSLFKEKKIEWTLWTENSFAVKLKCWLPSLFSMSRVYGCF